MTSPPASRLKTVRSVESMLTCVLDWLSAHPRSAAAEIGLMMGIKRKPLARLLGRAVRRRLVVRSGTRPHVVYSSAPKAEAPSSRSDAVARVRKVLAAEVGGLPPKDLLHLGMARAELFRALATGCAAGVLRKTGDAPNVRYHAVEAGESPAPTIKRPRGAALTRAVIGFVRAHEGCRFSELEAATGGTESQLRYALERARANGEIRLEGTTSRARYFAR